MEDDVDEMGRDLLVMRILRESTQDWTRELKLVLV